jgi:hypothetical protein
MHVILFYIKRPGRTCYGAAFHYPNIRHAASLFVHARTYCSQLRQGAAPRISYAEQETLVMVIINGVGVQLRARSAVFFGRVRRTRTYALQCRRFSDDDDRSFSCIWVKEVGRERA